MLATPFGDLSITDAFYTSGTVYYLTALLVMLGGFWGWRHRQ
jgi:hypothetical protein